MGSGASTSDLKNRIEAVEILGCNLSCDVGVGSVLG